MSAQITQDGWIEWSGGECPVEPGTDTEVQLRSGRVLRTIRPAHLAWGRSGDIIAYRVVSA